MNLRFRKHIICIFFSLATQTNPRLLFSEPLCSFTCFSFLSLAQLFHYVIVSPKSLHLCLYAAFFCFSICLCFLALQCISSLRPTVSNRCRSQTDAAEMRELKAATTTIKMRFAFIKLLKKKKKGAFEEVVVSY